jgi:uncharacterized membrane protein
MLTKTLWEELLLIVILQRREIRSKERKALTQGDTKTGKVD